MSHYQAVWDWRTRGITLAVTAILVSVAVPLVRSTLHAIPRPYGTLAGFGAVVILLALVTIIFAPRAYDIDGRTLHVRTLATRFAFDLTRLWEASERSGNEVFSGGTLRTFGCGGFFGYFGYFWNPDWGRFLAFATNREELVVLRFRDRVLVISPHGRQSFLQEAQRGIDRTKTSGTDLAA